MDKKYVKYLLEKTHQDYNQIADDFSRTRNYIWEELGFFREYALRGDKVLDLGCGNGRLYELLKEKSVDYYGIDNSEKLIEIAKIRYPKVKFLVADALNLPFPDSFFDKVFSIAVLHHIPSEELRLKFLEEIKRVLKPEGFLIITLWKFHASKDLYLISKYAILKLFGKSKLDWKDFFEPWGKKTERYYHCFSKKESACLLRKAGFKIKKCDIVRNRRGNRQNIYLIAQKPP